MNIQGAVYKEQPFSCFQTFDLIMQRVKTTIATIIAKSICILFYAILGLVLGSRTALTKSIRFVD